MSFNKIRPISESLLGIEIGKHDYRFFGINLLQPLGSEEKPESIQVL